MKKKQIRLTERDQKIFEYIMEMGFITTTQVFYGFFLKNNYVYEILKKNKVILSNKMVAARRRLRKLLEFRYLKKKEFGNTSIYLLTEKSANYLLGQNVEYEYRYKKTFSVVTFEHSRRLNYFRLFCEIMSISQGWVSERYLRLRYRTVDAYVDGVLKTKRQSVGIEMEISPKKRQAYIIKLRRGIDKIRSGELSKIIYFCDTKELCSYIYKLLNGDIRNEYKKNIYVGHWSRFEKEGLDMSALINFNDEILDLRLL